MIKRAAYKWDLSDSRLPKADLAYWSSKSPEERVAAVDYLRRQLNGTTARLQRSARVVKRA
jgi:hypothetical protein